MICLLPTPLQIFWAVNALKVSNPPFYKDTQRTDGFVKVNVKAQCYNLPNEKLLVHISSFHDSPVVGLTRGFTVIEYNSLSIWQTGHLCHDWSFCYIDSGPLPESEDSKESAFAFKIIVFLSSQFAMLWWNEY